jgi:hypothetical protein
MVMSLAPAAVVTTAIVSRSVYSPLPAIDCTVPLIPGGTMILWRTSGVSATSPMVRPPLTVSPGFTAGSKVQARVMSRGSTFSPRRIHAPLRACMPGSGRWMPS